MNPQNVTRRVKGMTTAQEERRHERHIQEYSRAEREQRECSKQLREQAYPQSLESYMMVARERRRCMSAEIIQGEQNPHWEKLRLLNKEYKEWQPKEGELYPIYITPFKTNIILFVKSYVKSV